MSTFQGEDQFDTALLLTMREELHHLKTQTDERLGGLEDAIATLAEEVKKLVVLRSAETRLRGSGDGAGDEFPPQETSEDVISPAEMIGDLEDVGGNWNYLIAQKGGYNNLLHIKVHELLELGENGTAFLTFLSQKRTTEVQNRLQQLQAEYQKLQGTQLQEHFRELWKSHYLLLKNKQARTWKEEIFLAAFDAFIAWIQT
jgi:hypothetical protein